MSEVQYLILHLRYSTSEHSISHVAHSANELYFDAMPFYQELYAPRTTHQEVTLLQLQIQIGYCIRHSGNISYTVPVT